MDKVGAQKSSNIRNGECGMSVVAELSFVKEQDIPCALFVLQ